MSKQTFIVDIDTDKATFEEWIKEHDKEVRAETIKQLGLENFKSIQNPITRKVTIEIDYDDRLNTEQIFGILFEQLKEKING